MANNPQPIASPGKAVFAPPTSCSIGALEDASNAFYLSLPSASPRDMELDLRAVTYIDLPSLVFVLALVSARRRQGLTTVVHVPKSRDVRDFMRVWAFGEAFRDVVGLPFSRAVPPGDIEYFSERPDPATVKYAGKVVPGVGRLLSDRFFALSTFFLGESFQDLPLRQAERWKQPLIESVLNKVLGGPSSYFASRIVFEAVLNALRHPTAAYLVTGSFLDSPSGEPRNKHFTLVIWDDGQSMVETLRIALAAGKSVRSSASPDLSLTYDVLVQDETSGRSDRAEQVMSDFLPSRDTDDCLLLLATVLPGITREIEGSGHDVHPELRRAHPHLSLPGMGLYVLTNTVVDVFGGTLSFRTGQFFMHIKQGTRANYRAKIRRFDPQVPVFQGNMLTIRIPLRS